MVKYIKSKGWTNLKKLLCTTLLLIIIFSTIVLASDESEETYSAVAQRLKYVNLIDGYSDNDLGLENTLTRAEACKMIALICGYTVDFNDESADETFEDVPKTHWAYNYIEYLAERKCVSGISENKFSPEENLKFEQLCALIVRALGYEDDSVVYPNGHLLIATHKYLIKEWDVGNDILRKDAFLMVNKALDVECRPPSLHLPGGLMPSEYDYIVAKNMRFLWESLNYRRILCNNFQFEDNKITVTYIDYRDKDTEKTEIFAAEYPYDYEALSNSAKRKFIWVDDNNLINENPRVISIFEIK